MSYDQWKRAEKDPEFAELKLLSFSLIKLLQKPETLKGHSGNEASLRPR